MRTIAKTAARSLAVFLALAWPGLLRADPPAELPAAAPAAAVHSLTRADALRWALQHNPALAAQRQQHGIAAASVVIARQYPFNPIWQSFIMGDSGPAHADVTNPVFVEQTVRLDLELRGQGKHRVAAARAALSRTDWEIAGFELAAAVRALRAFDAVVYRQDKLRLVEEIVSFQERNAAAVGQMARQGGRVHAADLIQAQAEVNAARAFRGPAQVALAAARQELLRALGVVCGEFAVEGTLDNSAGTCDAAALAQVALDHRPEVHARRLAVAEAESRIRLEVANRFGNPSVGPAFEFNETSVYFMGAWMVTPLPVLNTRKGEIMQRKAERERALLDLTQAQVLVQQDVAAALARLREARGWVETYDKQVLPSLEISLKDMERLFTQGEQGVDLLRVNDVRRRLLTARDAYLDALWETRQAETDLAAAIGDPSLALGAPAMPQAPAR